MFHDIAPHQLDKTYHTGIEPRENDYVTVVRGHQFLLSVDENGDPTGMMTYGGYRKWYPAAQKLIYLHSLDDRHVFGAVTDKEAPAGFIFASIRQAMRLPDRGIGFAAATGAHLMQWYDSHRLCGRCGHEMIRTEDERAVMCPVCRDRTYPTICPVVIVAVTNGDKLLMTRYKAKGPDSYRRLALVAGFCEYGESLEEAVQREVAEEAGLLVKNIRYYSSQPWPMSSSLIAGFFADVDGDDTIIVNADGKEELSEAIWVERENIRVVEDHMSVTRVMIDVFKEGREPK